MLMCGDHKQQQQNEFDRYTDNRWFYLLHFKTTQGTQVVYTWYGNKKSATLWLDSGMSSKLCMCVWWTKEKNTTSCCKSPQVLLLPHLRHRQIILKRPPNQPTYGPVILYVKCDWRWGRRGFDASDIIDKGPPKYCNLFLSAILLRK